MSDEQTDYSQVIDSKKIQHLRDQLADLGGAIGLAYSAYAKDAKIIRTLKKRRTQILSELAEEALKST